MVDPRCQACIDVGAYYCSECGADVYAHRERLHVGGLMPSAGRIPALVGRPITDDTETHQLPLWMTTDGKLTLGLPVDDPQYAGDIVYARFEIEDLLAAMAHAISQRP